MKDENAQPQDLRLRTKAFALRVIKLYAALPKTTVAQVLGKRVLRPAHQLEPVTAKLLGRDQRPSLWPR